MSVDTRGLHGVSILVDVYLERELIALVKRSLAQRPEASNADAVAR